MSKRVKSLYMVLALALVVWVFVRPGGLPLLLLVGLAVIVGLHGLVVIDARRGYGGRGIEHDLAKMRSRYPDGSGH